MIKVIKKLVGFLSGLIYIAVVLFLLVLSPLLMGWHPVVVLSPSMEPTLPVGTVTYYEKVKAFEDLKQGDIITFGSNGEEGTFITHRIVKVDNESKSFVTKGDGNGSPDPQPISMDMVQGKIVNFKIPWIGFTMMWVKNPLVIALLVGVILLNVLLGSIKK
ncbi:MAG: signal peptidase I [Eubacteriaceae bacterium]